MSPVHCCAAWGSLGGPALTTCFADGAVSPLLLSPRQAPTAHLSTVGAPGTRQIFLGKPPAWSPKQGREEKAGEGKGSNDLSAKHSTLKVLSGLFPSPDCPRESGAAQDAAFHPPVQPGPCPPRSTSRGPAFPPSRSKKMKIL